MTWPGIFGTWWQADPANDLVMIYLIQHQVPVSAALGGDDRHGTRGSRPPRLARLPAVASMPPWGTTFLDTVTLPS